MIDADTCKKGKEKVAEGLKNDQLSQQVKF